MIAASSNPHSISVDIESKSFDFFANMVLNGFQPSENENNITEDEQKLLAVTQLLWNNQTPLDFAWPCVGPFTLHPVINPRLAVELQFTTPRPDPDQAPYHVSHTWIPTPLLNETLGAFRIATNEIERAIRVPPLHLIRAEQAFVANLREATLPPSRRPDFHHNPMVGGPWLPVLIFLGACFPHGPTLRRIEKPSSFDF